MSAWRVAVRALYDLGGIASTPQVSDVTIIDAQPALRMAKQLGLVDGNGRQGGQRDVPAAWWLTSLGIAWCEGRVMEMRGTDYAERKLAASGKHRVQPAKLNPHPHRKMRFVATWLASLPRGIRLSQPTQRIEQREEVCA